MSPRRVTSAFVLWNVLTALLVIVCLVVLVAGFPGMIGRRAKFGLFRLPPPRGADDDRSPPRSR